MVSAIVVFLSGWTKRVSDSHLRVKPVRGRGRGGWGGWVWGAGGRGGMLCGRLHQLNTTFFVVFVPR